VKFGTAEEFSRSSITVLSLVGLGFHPPPGRPKNVELFCVFALFVCLFLSVCLSVCLSVTLLNVRVCALDFAMKALDYRNDFDTISSM